MVATNDDILLELQKITALLKGQYAKIEDAETKITETITKFETIINNPTL